MGSECRPGAGAAIPAAVGGRDAGGRAAAAHQHGEGVFLVLLLQEDEDVCHQQHQDVWEGAQGHEMLGWVRGGGASHPAEPQGPRSPRAAPKFVHGG